MTAKAQGCATYTVCQGCNHMYKHEVYMCVSGHNICPDCLEDLPEPKACPRCNKRFGDRPKRNSALEQEMAKCGLFVAKCQYSRWGCHKEAMRAEIVAHERVCAYQAMQGLTVRCSDLVSQRSFPSDLTGVKHQDGIVDYWEKDAVVKMTSTVPKNSIDPVTCNWQWNGTWFVRFWERVKDGGDGSYAWVAVAGDDLVANKYSYELSLVNDHIEPEYRFKGTTLHISKNVEYVERTGQGLPLTNDVLFRYKQGTEQVNGQLNYKIVFSVKIHEKSRPLSQMSPSCSSSTTNNI